MSDLLIRCSSLGKLMTEPRSKSEGPLSVTAKTHIREIAAQTIFGVVFEFSAKETEKGIRLEGEAIALLNRVRGLALTKNAERRDDGFITGECDLWNPAARGGHDLKVPWSIKTFPLISAAAEDKDYLWQCRGYMKLWGAQQWEVNYVLLDTPDDLIGYEPQAMHFVSHAPEHMRLTTWTVHRDPEAEALIAEKVRLGREYLKQVLVEFDLQHRQGAKEPPPWVTEDVPVAAPAPAPPPIAAAREPSPAKTAALPASLFG
jgi:hypothetical protein